MVFVALQEIKIHQITHYMVPIGYRVDDVEYHIILCVKGSLVLAKD